MRQELAETLLAKIMDWTDAEKAAERRHLESFALYKYDDYQQFTPGSRFVESLALWLRQFERGEERRTAYRFVRHRLVFVSGSEMNHLVQLCMPTIIRPRLIRDAAADLAVEEHRVKFVTESVEYRALLRRTLVLGLSDGARTDQFRRANPRDMSNEQVFHAYDVSEGKATGLLKKLEKDLAEILGRAPEPGEKRFRYVVLLDDFSASGTSAIRREGDGSLDGKIPRIVRELASNSALGAVIADAGVRVVVVLYICSEQAIAHVRRHLDTLSFPKGQIEFEVVSRLSTSTPLDDVDDAGILGLANQDRYFDPVVDDEHAEKGGTSKRLGYAEGRLPLVLGHNTPNNSIYLIWAEDAQKVRGLFPRVSRHRERRG